LAPLPTRIANPFRSFAGSFLLPPTNARPSATPDLNLPDIVEEGVNATLLRANYQNPPTTLEQRQPLFANTTAGEFNNSNKNSFFRYESLQRLSNLTTTRSNVYALWVTVGYFEVEKFDRYDPLLPGQEFHEHVYQDGYTIGQELGIDTGDVHRHRAFYVIDRSIPVGFVPGEDLNTEEAVILRRFIE
jgi:hypothetical protein